MLRDVDQVSKELNVSKTAIYNKLKINQFKDKIVKKNGKSMIDEDLFNLIKDSLKSRNQVGNEVENKKIYSDENQEIAMDREDLFNFNKQLIDSLLEQLKEKDKQIEELHKLIENNQVLLKKEQESKQLQLEEHFKEVDIKLVDLRTKIDSNKEKNKSFFKNWFK